MKGPSVREKKGNFRFKLTLFAIVKETRQTLESSIKKKGIFTGRDLEEKLLGYKKPTTCRKIEKRNNSRECQKKKTPRIPRSYYMTSSGNRISRSLRGVPAPDVSIRAAEVT